MKKINFIYYLSLIFVLLAILWNFSNIGDVIINNFNLPSIIYTSPDTLSNITNFYSIPFLLISLVLGNKSKNKVSWIISIAILVKLIIEGIAIIVASI